jgi:hypothetical protein
VETGTGNTRMENGSVKICKIFVRGGSWRSRKVIEAGIVK